MGDGEEGGEGAEESVLGGTWKWKLSSTVGDGQNLREARKGVMLENVHRWPMLLKGDRHK